MAGNYDFGLRVANSCKKNSRAYLILYVIEIILAITCGVCFMNYIHDVIAYGYANKYDVVNSFGSFLAIGNNFYNSFFTGDPHFYAFFVTIIAIAIIGLALIILGITLTVQTYSFNKHFGSSKHLWILYFLGIFTIIPGICAAFMTISKSKYVLKHQHQQ